MPDHKPREPKRRESQEHPASQPIAASTLFQGRHQALIEHEGEIYRLVLTRNNKLLLQK
jgi:hemin uptake protein HemP